ncbi:MAG: MATE family efflux transporter [Oscillospiraceae bacterium]|nr:MATE family efflux transporter [Oscillospiraceae bacterium]
MDNQQERKFREMTEEPVGRLISRLAVPCIISMLVTAFYNMADTFFVGMLHSNSATGAVGVVFSMMAVIQAVGFFYGHGSGNFISRELGKHHLEIASNMASTAFFAAMLTGLAICVLGQLFLVPLATLLGSTPTILPYAAAYLRVILFGAPWMIASLVLNNQLRFQGSAVYGMAGITSGAILNIGLDPLFIFTFRLGVAGAAWATIVSQFVSFCLLHYGCSRGGNLRIRPSCVRFRWTYFRAIIQGGLPSLARQSLGSVATICLNRAAGPYGDAAIAAMGIVQRVTLSCASAMIGFGQGFQPVCGFNYGAKRFERVKEGFWFSFRVSAAFLLCVGMLCFAFAPSVVSRFRDDPDVIQIGALALRFQCVTLCFQSWVVMSNMMLQTIGKTVPATFLAAARQGMFFLPLILILPRLLGLIGVQSAQAAADACTLLCAVPIQLYALRRLGQE